jgi:hypothetical protein
MWIDPAPFPLGVIKHGAPFSGASSRISVLIRGNMVTLSGLDGRALQSARLINAGGTVVSRGEMASPDTRRFKIGLLSTGIYFISWQESNTVKARIVTTTR